MKKYCIINLCVLILIVSHQQSKAQSKAQTRISPGVKLEKMQLRPVEALVIEGGDYYSHYVKPSASIEITITYNSGQTVKDQFEVSRNSEPNFAFREPGSSLTKKIALQHIQKMVRISANLWEIHLNSGLVSKANWVEGYGGRYGTGRWLIPQQRLWKLIKNEEKTVSRDIRSVKFINIKWQPYNNEDAYAPWSNKSAVVVSLKNGQILRAQSWYIYDYCGHWSSTTAHTRPSQYSSMFWESGQDQDNGYTSNIDNIQEINFTERYAERGSLPQLSVYYLDGSKKLKYLYLSTESHGGKERMGFDYYLDSIVLESNFGWTETLLCNVVKISFVREATTKEVNWTGWRGSEGTGVSAETNLPTEWSADKNIKWKSALPGRGHSSPIVWGNQIFLTTDIEGDIVPGAKAVKHMIEGQEFIHPDSIAADRNHTFKVLSVDRPTGKILWEQTAYTGTVYDGRHRKGSYAAPTMVTDGQFVYAWFGGEGDGLYCYDFKGKLIWKTPIAKIASVGMGPSTSPVMADGVIALQCDEDEGKNSFIAGVDKKTGKEVWRTVRPVQAGWSTPLVIKTARGNEIVTSGFEWVISYEPKTGKELWRMKGPQSNALPTPLVGFGMVYAYSGYPVKKTLAIKLGGSGDVTETGLAWSYDKGTAYIPSSILYGDNIYLMTDRGILTCLDAKTGKMIYEGGRVPVPATFTASPVAFDGKILLTSEDGDTYVIKAGAKHEILATNSVGEPVYASPAISDGMIFIRGEKNLYCISNKK